ncbi:putative disease resistance protein RGA1 [Triticum aestivum]|nr:putative disease resistance protein RGA1 [Triticum aestivum]
MAVGWDWDSAAFIAIVGWLVSPIITLLLPNILSCGFDASRKLWELEIHVIPELNKTLLAVDQKRMLHRGGISDVATLDKMAAVLRHAREEAEDIFDDAQHKIVGGDSILQTCNTRIERIARSGSAQLLQWARNIFLRRSEDALPVISTAVAPSGEPVPVTAPSDSSGWWSSCWCSSFYLLKFCCTSLYNSVVDVFKVACLYRDWSYDVVGITSYQENASASHSLGAAISRWNLKRRIEELERVVNEVKKSELLCVPRDIAPDDIANKNRCRIRTASKRKVFGREELRDDIMTRFHETPHGDAPSSSTSPCYSVIGIYGVAGSGKTTFAQYIRDYIKEECKQKLFDTIMCIHVSETFSVDDIFHEMLKDITSNRHSNISDHEELEEKLKESLCGKRFFLILDDLWVKSKNDIRLEELISPLNAGIKGSTILVTARTKDAAGVLCADEPIKLPDLDEDQYLTMFMHYALGGTSVGADEFVRVGRLIANKLHRSPIAAVVVAGRLGTNPNIKFGKNIEKLDMLNDTMHALWWSYQQLNPDIRRCLEYYNIFPKRFKLTRVELVRLWIAQGFVKNSCATEDTEDVAEGYIQELVACSFLQPEGDYFTIHDLMHDLAKKVSGSDYFRIENKWIESGEGWKGDVPRDVRHLFVQNYDSEWITEKILRLEKLRTIYVVERGTLLEDKVIESICKRLPKLRVLSIDWSNQYCALENPRKFLIPESISQLKHLRYLAFRTELSCTINLPSALSKLHHIQLLDFGYGEILEFSFADLVNLQHMICHSDFPNIGRMTSLQTLPCFIVKNEQGYEVKQLRNLNKLRGDLCILGLNIVKSKEEALEANLAAKERLTCVSLWWYPGDTRCNSEIQAEVIEGLCPPVGLETLHIFYYQGTRYPDWMVGKHNGGPKDLQELWLNGWSQLGSGPELEAVPHLRVLRFSACSWKFLPNNMEHLTSLKELSITDCKNIRSLPTLPQSLKMFRLEGCNDEFMKSCETVGHPNWQKIRHISEKTFRCKTVIPFCLTFWYLYKHCLCNMMICY